MSVDDFIRCFQDRLFWQDHSRLSLEQQTHAVRFFNRALAPTGKAFSSVSLNVFSLNNHSLTPPQLHSLYGRMPIIYGLLADGGLPNFQRTLGDIARRTGQRHILQPSQDGFDANFYRLLTVDDPPALIHLDAVMLGIYTATPMLARYFKDHYRVAFHPTSGAFFACHRFIAPDACERAVRPDDLSSADKAVLAAIRDPASSDAESSLRAALSLQPRHAEGNYLMGQIARTRGDLGAAAEHFFTAAAVTSGHDLDAIVERAEVLAAMGNTAGAAEALGHVEKYFRWQGGVWSEVQPWAALFTRDPEHIAARFNAISQRVAAR